MKAYNRLMEQLHFREEFCEETLHKAECIAARQRRLPRGLAVAACVCLCMVALLGTALAVSGQLRALLLPNRQIETVETPSLPEKAGTMVENNIDVLTAHYYKLDGVLEAHAGIGSVLPVQKDGEITFYRINENGELEKAKAPRIIQKELEYKGKTWSVNMEIYSGDIPTAVEGIQIYPMADESYRVLGRWENGVWYPVFVDLNTWEIEDPMGHVSFEASKDALKTWVTAHRGYPTLLILSELSGDRERVYAADARSGEVVCLGEGETGQWFLCEGKIYSYIEGVLSRMDSSYQMQPLFEGRFCMRSANYAHCREGENLRVLDLKTGNEVLLENCADLFDDPFVSFNRSGTKLSIANFESTAGLGTNAIAIADMENGEMVTLERIPGMTESVCGWYDDEHFLIAGTVKEDWYLCLYEME